MKKLSIFSTLGLTVLSTTLLTAGATQMPSNTTATDQSATGQNQNGQQPPSPADNGTQQGMDQGGTQQEDDDVIIIEEDQDDQEENDQAPSN